MGRVLDGKAPEMGRGLKRDPEYPLLLETMCWSGLGVKEGGFGSGI